MDSDHLDADCVINFNAVRTSNTILAESMPQCLHNVANCLC